MPIDIAIDKNRRTSYSVVGDYETVSGLNAVHQALFIAIYETVDMGTPSFVEDAIEEQRSDIESTVQSHPFSRDPVSVSVEEQDPENNQITYSVKTARIEFSTETQ